MMDIGIGSAIVGCRLKQVRLSWKYHTNRKLRRYSVLYRSKETALPDFSKEDDVVGDVFFDVRINTIAILNVPF
jgi:hypothetical protein